VGWSSPAGFAGIEIMGDGGCIIEDYRGSLQVATGRFSPDARKRLDLPMRTVDRDPTAGGWRVEIGEVVKAFRRNDDLGMGIDVGGQALAVALAAYESSRTGKAVHVAE
ncbi:MAG TPA: hypothetical protein VLM89_05670, partial [Phycisphaerae bacterium]|nr:hypothetical protein [Phycisphaerae bacterium]